MTNMPGKLLLGCLLLGGMMFAQAASGAAVTVSTGKVEAAPGKEVEIPITLKGVKDAKGVSCMQVRLNFDPNLLTFKSLDKGPALPSALFEKSVDEKDSPGKVGLTFVCGSKTPGSKEMACVEQDGVVLKVTFVVNEKASSGQKCPLKLDRYNLFDNDVDPTALEVVSEDGEFTVTGGLPWLWIAIGAGVAVFLLLILLVMASRGGGNQQRGPMYTMPQGAPYAMPPQQQGGHGGYVPPRFTPEGAPATFAHACKKCGGIIQLPRAMMGQTFQCGACGATQVAGT